jgi:hypothetical protein
MAIATSGTASNYLRRAPSPSGLAEVLDVILDKGLVIDVSVISSLPWRSACSASSLSASGALRSQR